MQTPFFQTGCLTVVNLDLLLCTGFDFEHADLFLCLIITKRPVFSVISYANILYATLLVTIDKC